MLQFKLNLVILQEWQCNAKVVLLAEKGREFLAHWIKAEPTV